MPVVIIQMVAGRSMDQKRQLVAAITDAMVGIVGARRDRTNIIIQEVEPENWAHDGMLMEDQRTLTP
ncbi:MAG: tautomerase family protein [Candidatus Dormibacteraceae bacterium]